MNKKNKIQLTMETHPQRFADGKATVLMKFKDIKMKLKYFGSEKKTI